MVEQLIRNQQVEGSIPPISSTRLAKAPPSQDVLLNTGGTAVVADMIRTGKDRVRFPDGSNGKAPLIKGFRH